MNRIRFTLLTLLMLPLSLLVATFAWQVLRTILLPTHVSVWANLGLYRWAALGAVLYALLHRFVHKNIRWLETLSHELTHSVVAILFMRRVHVLHAEEGSGEIRTSSNHTYDLVPLALAPYCLPLFTYLLLVIRCLISAEGLWVFDVLVGITLSFHTHCFVDQTGPHQPDIHQYPLPFSYLYIVTFLVFNASIILVSFWPQRHVFNALWYFCTTSFHTVLSLF